MLSLLGIFHWRISMEVYTGGIHSHIIGIVFYVTFVCEVKRTATFDQANMVESI